MSSPTRNAPYDWRASTKKGALSIVMWVFGLSTSLLLVGLWGRAVTVDQTTVAESAATIVDADIARDRVMDWVADAMVHASVASPERAAVVVDRVKDTPEMQTAIHNLTSAFVAALFAPEGTDPVIDVHDAVRPAVPVLASAMADEAGVLDESTILAALDETTIGLDTDDAAGVVAVVEGARSFVNLAVVVALLVMLGASIAAIALSQERFAMVRTLATRVVVSALSFAVFFRLGRWALDPSRGRSPIAGGTSILLGSNGHVFLLTALVAAVVAALGGWVAWRRRLTRRPVIITEATDSDDDTRELVLV
ncbi:MAG: hypothetical protein KDB69_09005 [Acidimicrobiia bacterium]|nr:hypothetical protein [Acidimicrobiia bacterium]